jgi:hypothetical protein
MNVRYSEMAYVPFAFVAFCGEGSFVTPIAYPRSLSLHDSALENYFLCKIDNNHH